MIMVNKRKYGAMKIVVLAALITTFVSACGSKSSNELGIRDNYPGSGNASSPQVANQDGYNDDYYKESDGGYEISASDVAYEVEQKIIKTADLNMNVKNYSTAENEIKAIVFGVGGYVENSNSYVNMYRNNFEYKAGRMTVRVPAEHFNEIKSKIASLGKVTNESEKSDNVTGQYYDIQARLTAKLAEEARLLELYAKAEKIDEMIQIEDRLSYVRSDIEAYNIRLNNIDRLASFSTLHIWLTETADAEIAPVSENFWQTVKNAFIGSVNGMRKFFEGTVVFLAAVALPLVFIVIIALIMIVFIKRINKKSKNKLKGDKQND